MPNETGIDRLRWTGRVAMSLRDLVPRMTKTADGRPEVLRLLDFVRRGGVSPDLRITCRGKTDGGGAQVQAVMSAMCFAAASGLRYVHSPFHSISHGSGEGDWANRWEDFFRLGDGEAQISETDDSIVPLTAFLADRRLRRDPRLVVACLHFHDFVDRDPDSYRAILPELRRKYALSAKSHIRAPHSLDGINIAIHLRRGDVGSGMADRYSQDDALLRTIERAHAICASCGPVRLDVYSEGESASFRRFADLGCDLHLNTDVFVTIADLTCAHVLVMAKSSFSYVPALLGDGVTLYEPFWHAPLSDWIVREADGSFDRARFEAALRR